ncbi:MAG: 50S ribosomal protein L1 [Candidatus Woesearchaeota archaeon]
MDKNLIANTLKNLKENSPKKNFKQSVDLIINLKGLDLKKPDHQINIFATLPHDTGKKISVCAFVDADMEKKAKEACDEVILPDQFAKFKNKSEIKKLANKYNFFVAQASIMPKVATVFGRYLGPRGKMPNPKIGSVLPPTANMKQLYDKLKNTISLVTKNEPTIKCRVGNEDTSDDALIDNILTVYNSIIPKLPNEKHNVKSVMIKLTMGPAFAISKAAEEKDDKKQGKIKAVQNPKEPSKEEKPQEQAKEEKPEGKKPQQQKKPLKNKAKENKKQTK